MSCETATRCASSVKVCCMSQFCNCGPESNVFCSTKWRELRNKLLLERHLSMATKPQRIPTAMQLLLAVIGSELPKLRSFSTSTTQGHNAAVEERKCLCYKGLCQSIGRQRAVLQLQDLKDGSHPTKGRSSAINICPPTP